MLLAPRHPAAIGAILALAIPGAVVAASPASAATSCYGSSCTGLDPSSTTCADDARTVEVGGGTGEIQLRYSPSCRAAWARLQWSRGSGYIKVDNDNGDAYKATVTGSGKTNVFTLMVNDKDITSNAQYFWDGGRQWDSTPRY
ncbi:DUF2690 domain-containing protein [Streptomyces sp. NPDC020379]|uniref:DUF2690 domain-containing protein n=1 Tax=Streptomyces sp. NPDC020379 TaxID=3365071 RepID=UPI0037A5B545